MRAASSWHLVKESIKFWWPFQKTLPTWQLFPCKYHHQPLLPCSTSVNAWDANEGTGEVDGK